MCGEDWGVVKVKENVGEVRGDVGKCVGVWVEMKKDVGKCRGSC